MENKNNQSPSYQTWLKLLYNEFKKSPNRNTTEFEKALIRQMKGDERALQNQD